MSDSGVDLLDNVQDYVNLECASRLRLFFGACDLGGAVVENETYLLRFRGILDGRPDRFRNPMACLQHMLDIVGVDIVHTRTLNSSQEDLDRCKVELAYPSFVVEVCITLGEDDFKKFRQKMCDRYLRCAGDDMTREVLFTKLHQQDYFDDSDLRSKVIAELKSSDRNDLAGYIEDFYQNNRRFQRFSDYRRFIRSTQDSGSSGGHSTTVPGALGSQSQSGTTTSTGRGAGTTEPGVSTQLLGGENGPPTYRTFQQGGPGIDVRAPIPPGMTRPGPSQTTTITSSPPTKASKRRRSRGECILILWLCLPILGCILCSLLTLLCGAGSIAFAAYTSVQVSSMTSTVYGTGGETVVIAEFTDQVALTLTNTTIVECLVDEDSDFSHNHQLYTVQGNLPHQSRNLTSSSDAENRTESDCKESLGPDNLYLLEDSNITFEIWIESIDGQSGQRGTLLIFDSNDVYVRYISSGDCPQNSGAVVENNLNIGDEGFLRTSVKFTAKRNGYHYIIAKTPPNVRLRYDYTILQLYLNPDDFSQTPCTFSDNAGTSCYLGSVSQTPVYLVDSIEPNTADEPVSTHVCLTTSWGNGAVGSVVSLGVVCVFCFFIVISIIVYSCNCCRKEKYDVTDV